MSDTEFNFTAQAIEIAFESTKQRLIETIEGIDLVPPQMLDEIISGTLAIGGMTGAFMLGIGIAPDEQEQDQFTRSFLTINQKLLELRDTPAAPSGECFYGFTTPTTSNSSVGWVVTIVRSDGYVVMTSDPLAMTLKDVRRYIMVEKLHGGVVVKWIDHPDQIDIPAVREAWHREIENQSN